MEYFQLLHRFPSKVVVSPWRGAATDSTGAMTRRVRIALGLTHCAGEAQRQHDARVRCTEAPGTDGAEEARFRFRGARPRPAAIEDPSGRDSPAFDGDREPHEPGERCVSRQPLLMVAAL